MTNLDLELAINSGASILDMLTLCEVDPEEVFEDWDEEEDDDDYEPDWDMDFGFDPYEGCYTWDC